MVLSLLPAGMAAADVIATDDVEACEGTEGWVEFDAPLGGFATEIDCIAAFGITEGLDDGTYGQAQSVTRAQMAVFLSSLALQAQSGSLDIPESYDADAFDDIENSFARDAINLIASLGITEGTEGGESYNPSGIVTRQQMASFVARAHVALDVDFDGIEVDEDAFDDVDADNVHFDNINLLAAAGVVQGTAEGIYSPAAVVTRGQMAAFLARSIGVLEDQGLWNGERIERETPAESNQTFTVTPDDFALLSGSGGATDGRGEREFTVTGFGDEESVVIDFALAEDVSVDAGTVTFEPVNATATPVIADFDADAGVILEDDQVTLDDVTLPYTLGEELDIEGVDELTFTVTLNANVVENVVPVVYVGNDDDALVLDADGAPEEAFGVGGESYFVNPALDEGDNVTAAVGETAEATVQVLEEDAGDDLEVAGIPIEFRVVDADIHPADFDAITPGQRLAAGTVTTDAGGEAVVEFDGDAPDDGDDFAVYFKWEGTGSLDGLVDQTTDGRRVTVTFFESDGEAAAATFAFDSAVDATVFDAVSFDTQDDNIFVTGSSLAASVTTTVVDAANAPVAGLDIDVAVTDTNDGAVFSTSVTTDADGQATVTYPAAARPAADAPRIDAVTFDFDNGLADKVVYVGFAVENDDTNLLDTDLIVAADTDAGLVFTATDRDFNVAAAATSLQWTNFTDAAQWNIEVADGSEDFVVGDVTYDDGAAGGAETYPVTEAAFTAALANAIERDLGATAGDLTGVFAMNTDNLDVPADNTFTLKVDVSE